MLPDSVTLAESGPCELKSFTIGFDDNQVQDTSGFPRFLEAVGSNLKNMTIGKGKAQFDDNAVLQCCPLLEELVLYEGAVDIRLNFSEFHKSKRNLPTLTYNWASLAASLSDFADLSNPLSRCLKKLRVHLCRCVPDDQTANYRCRTEEDVAALLQLLETNRTLEYLEVVAPLEYDSYFDAFRAYHLQAMWAPRETLSLENKAAFLSVVSVRKAFTEASTKRSRQGSPRANGPVNEFDQLVLSKIFGFAADPVIRRVYFHRDIIRENCRFFQMAL